MNLQQRRKELAALDNEQKQLLAQMEALINEEGNDSEDEYDAIEAKYDANVKKIGKLKKLVEAAANASSTLHEETEEQQDGRIGNARPAFESDPNCGYKSPKAFLVDVMKASNGEEPSDQLKFLAAQGSDEHSTVDFARGGVLVPDGFLPNLLSVAAEADPISGMVTRVPMSAPTVKIPARTDKNHSSSVSGGLTVSRTAETQDGTSSRLAMENVTLEATALVGVSFASAQLLRDSAISFAAIMEAGFRDEFAAVGLKEKIRGTGNGEPQGVLNADCLVSVSRTTSSQIKAADITAMRKRCYNYGRAVWLANHDTLDYLMSAHIALTNASVSLFAPGNGTDKPDTLMGRPIYFSEFATALGTVGDLILGDWSQYLWGTRGSEIPERAESVHVRFLANESAFRFTIENDGRPWWRSALTPQNGANTLSPFVTIAT